MKLKITPVVGPLAALLLVAGLPLVTVAQTTGRKNPDLVLRAGISSSSTVRPATAATERAAAMWRQR